VALPGAVLCSHPPSDWAAASANAVEIRTVEVLHIMVNGSCRVAKADARSAG
jgi:hypothetical protein